MGLELDRQMESLNCFRALVGDSWIEDQVKRRARLEIESCLWERYEIPDTTGKFWLLCIYDK